jgi:type II secretory pathway component PulF
VPLLLFLSLYVVPVFTGVFAEFDLILTDLTETIIGTAELMPALIGGLLLVAFLIPLLLRVIGGRWLFHRVRIAVPVLGKFWNWSGQREFAALLASFLQLRLPLTSAVRHASEIVKDGNIARACPRLIQRLESGEGLSSALSHSMHFDRTLAGLAAWGEKHNALPDALRIAVEVFDDRIEQHAAVVRRLLPPLTMVCVAVLMFFIIAGLMMPLLDLIQFLM